MRKVLLSLFVFLLAQAFAFAKTEMTSALPSYKEITENNGQKIIIWEITAKDSEAPKILAQKLSASGELMWLKDLELTVKSKRIQNSHRLIPDGKGGVIITWEERSIENEETDIYAQRIDSLGKRLWGANGVAISEAIGSQITPIIIADEHQGAYIVWSDCRNDLTATNWDIYAQRIDSKGAAVWQANGVPISTDIKDEFVGKILLANNGITVIWNKVLPEIAGTDESLEFYFRKVDLNGEAVQTMASEKFLALTAGQNFEIGNDFLSDGNDGFYLSIAFNDNELNTGLYLQHVLATGEPAFKGDYGVLVDSLNTIQHVNLEVDTKGAVLVSWLNNSADSAVMLSQRFDAEGSLVLPDSSITDLNEELLAEVAVLEDSTQTIFTVASNVVAPTTSTMSPKTISGIRDNRKNAETIAGNYSNFRKNEISNDALSGYRKLPKTLSHLGFSVNNATSLISITTPKTSQSIKNTSENDFNLSRQLGMLLKSVDLNYSIKRQILKPSASSCASLVINLGLLYYT